MAKTIFKHKNGDIHCGLVCPSNEWTEATKDDVKKALTKLGNRKLWRCNVCNDLHMSLEPPHECPTCHYIDAYVEINLNEFKTLVEL